MQLGVAVVSVFTKDNICFQKKNSLRVFVTFCFVSKH